MSFLGLIGLQPGISHASGHAFALTPPPQAETPFGASGNNPHALSAGKYRFSRIEKPPTHGLIPSNIRHPRDTIPRWQRPSNTTDTPPTPPDLPHNVSQAPPIPARPKFSPIHDRAQNLLTIAYSRIFSCTPAAAQSDLRMADRTLYHEWRNISSIDEVAWPPGEPPGSPYSLAFAAGEITSRLINFPAMEDDDVIAIASHYITRQATYAPDDADRYAVYQSVLQRGLDWIDPDKVRARHLSSTEILQAVYHYRRPDVASCAALTQVMQHERNVMLDEAALIFFHTRPDLDSVPQNARIDSVRQQYANALAREWLDVSLGLRLLPSSPIPLSNAQFWFDGKSVQNALGKTLEEITSEIFARLPAAEEGESFEKVKHYAGLSRHLFGQPEYPITHRRWTELIQSMHGTTTAQAPYSRREGTVDIDGWHVNRDEIYTLLEKTWNALGLDTCYPAGTPHHELATTLRQLGPSHGIFFDAPNNPAELMTAFNRLQDAWREAPHAAVSPFLFTAKNLAHRSNVFFFNTNSPHSAPLQAFDRIYRDAMPALQQAGIDVVADVAHWNAVLDSTEKPSAGIRKEIASSQTTERLSMYANLWEKSRQIPVAMETISYANTTHLFGQLHDYLSQRLLAHAAPPAYNERQAVRRILHEKLAMTDDDLNRTRAVLIGVPRLENRLMRLLPIEEFLLRSKSPVSIMRGDNGVIVPATELKKIKIEAALSLSRHPAVVARSHELLRRLNAPYEASAVDTLTQLQVADMTGTPRPVWIDDFLAVLERMFGSPTVTAMVNAIGSGDPRQILGLLPFVIPVFDIVKGVSEGDWGRTRKGLINFCADGVFTLVGAGIEAGLARNMARATARLARAATPTIERAGIDSLRALGTLAPEFSATRLREHPTIIDNDAFDVHAASSSGQTQAKAIEAAGVGDTSGKPTPSVYFLEVDGRTVPATLAAGGFTESNLRGEPVPGAPPIFTEPNSGSHYRLAKQHGLPQGAAGVLDSQLALRGTVSDIVQYWSTIDVPAARVASPAPLDLIRTLFRRNSHPMHAEFEQLMVDVYTRSETGRVIINDAFKRAPYDRRGCTITYDATEAGQGDDRIWFLSNDDLFQIFYTGPTGPVRFQTKRMLLHEAMHWLSRQSDAPIQEAYRTRGGNIALVEKALAETLDSPPFPPRTTYALQSSFNVLHHKDGSFRTRNSDVRKLHEWTIAEDRYLDRVLDRKRLYPPSMYAMGQKITDRATVRQSLELVAHLVQKVGVLGDGNAKRISGLLADSFDFASYAQRNILKKLITHSKTFRILAAAWERTPRHAPVSIRSMPADTSFARYAQRNRFSHVISFGNDRIWLNTQPLFYYSIFDTTPLSEERLLLDAWLELFVNTLVPSIKNIPLQEFSERGVEVLLSNEVMQQLGGAAAGAEPYRICAALTTGSDNYLPHQSAATRAAFSEDGYLYTHARQLLAELPEQVESEPLPCPAERRMSSLLSCLDI
jgi:hypothetical protein